MRAYLDGNVICLETHTFCLGKQRETLVKKMKVDEAEKLIRDLTILVREIRDER